MSPDERATACVPTAHDLVRAVADYDELGVARALRDADLTALCVVLADMIARPSESAWLRALLADAADPEVSVSTLCWRYGLTSGQVDRIVRDNRVARDANHDHHESAVQLTGGRWVNVRGVQRWVPEEVARCG